MAIRQAVRRYVLIDGRKENLTSVRYYARFSHDYNNSYQRSE